MNKINESTNIRAIGWYWIERNVNSPKEIQKVPLFRDSIQLTYAIQKIVVTIKATKFLLSVVSRMKENIETLVISAQNDARTSNCVVFLMKT
jgi:hypothetical protein